ncbi:flavodoxin family protein [Ochrobactrum quorumnocens]|uniref:NAD(P)H-dependent oxidoreductase n=1 Tax=Ochrobactrum quorumnocens TaxID=271865 RepID=A0A5N1JI93_9HYPH|nr:NAD(P)H-dependent oxidoreductase [[Ochrobactrum] quorumnocens]KAA9356150.1 NAD(P)H-dependent oxidoreductase [[Ochrobactrum] quorumnocens]
MSSPSQKPLKALALNATLKTSEKQSSTQRLLSYVDTALDPFGVVTEHVLLTDFTIAPGVSSDEGGDDQWPQLRRKIIDADILLIGTPIWLGQPSSVCKRALERMDAFLSETDDKNRMPSYGTVAAVVVVGNEDGAHHVSAEVFQALNDVGFTLPANAVTYWVGEAMQSTNFVDLDEIPETVVTATRLLATNCVHLALALRDKPYPGFK